MKVSNLKKSSHVFFALSMVLFAGAGGSAFADDFRNSELAVPAEEMAGAAAAAYGAVHGERQAISILRKEGASTGFRDRLTDDVDVRYRALRRGGAFGAGYLMTDSILRTHDTMSGKPQMDHDEKATGAGLLVAGSMEYVGLKRNGLNGNRLLGASALAGGAMLLGPEDRVANDLLTAGVLTASSVEAHRALKKDLGNKGTKVVRAATGTTAIFMTLDALHQLNKRAGEQNACAEAGEEKDCSKIADGTQAKAPEVAIGGIAAHAAHDAQADIASALDPM